MRRAIALGAGALAAATLFAGMVHAVLVVGDVSEPAAVTVYGATLRRVWAAAAALLAVFGVVIGGIALVRPANRLASAPGRVKASTVALVAGLTALVNGGLNVATADGGPGTGNGVVAGAAAFVLGLIAVAIGGIDRTRGRHVANPGRDFAPAGTELESRATSLQTRAWVSLAAVLVLVMATLLFACAGTMDYWQAWCYVSLFTVFAAAVTRDLSRHRPDLLARRLSAGPVAEPRPVQRRIMLVASLGFASLLVVPALDHRFGWTHVPLAGVVFGDILFALGFGFTWRVYRGNAFASATIRVAKDQALVSTGPYAVVRHPMYAGALVYLLGTPLALGSLAGLAGLPVMLLCLIWRLLDEERLLTQDLPGYAAYQSRVRNRLIPFLW